MKEEPEEGTEGSSGYGGQANAKPSIQNQSLPTDEDEMDFKYILPVPTPLDPLETDDAPFCPIVTPLELVSVSYFNENVDEDDETKPGLPTLETVINEGQQGDVDVQEEANPVSISIPFMCPICDMGFPSQQPFQLHMTDVHDDATRPHACSHCWKRFAKLCLLKKHETTHDPTRYQGEPQFPCDMCDKKYYFNHSLECHRKKIHLAQQLPLSQPFNSNPVNSQHPSMGVKKKKAKLFKCSLCDLRFGTEGLLVRHFRCHTKQFKQFHCEEFGQTFSSTRGLNNTRHRTEPSRPTFRSDKACGSCGKVFKLRSNLLKHMLSHPEARPHECSECGQRFARKKAMKAHYKCQHAPVQNGGAQRGNINTAHKCLICGKDDLPTRSHLRQHRNDVHPHIPLPLDPDMEKPFGCGVCGKPYHNRGQAMVCALLKHDPTSLHKTMFKYKCPGCPEEAFGFHSRLALKSHWEKEHAEEPVPAQLTVPWGKSETHTLPCVRANRKLANQIRLNGPEVKSEFPLYLEFDLLPVQNKFNFQNKNSRKEEKSRPYRKKFVKHQPPHQHQDPHYGVKKPRGRPPGKSRGEAVSEPKTTCYASPYICAVCGKTFGKYTSRRLHEQIHNRTKGKGKRKGGRPKKIPLATSDPEQVMKKVIFASVNVNDTSAIRNILGGRELSIVLSRVH